MTAHRILVVEDEPSLLMTLRDRLEAEGYAVHTEEHGDHGLRAAREAHCDLLVLDIALPGIGGLDILETLRNEGNDLPVLLLTARAQIADKVMGLKLGADDYLTKPFEMAELIARVEALLRRSRAGPSKQRTSYDFADVKIDVDGAEVHKAGRRVELSQLEFKLLLYLVDHEGKVVSRDQLLDEVWGYDASVYSRTVDVHIASLRQKVETHASKPRHIVTVHGRGYKFLRAP